MDSSATVCLCSRPGASHNLFLLRSHYPYLSSNLSIMEGNHEAKDGSGGGTEHRRRKRMQTLRGAFSRMGKRKRLGGMMRSISSLQLGSQSPDDGSLKTDFAADDSSYSPSPSSSSRYSSSVGLNEMVQGDDDGEIKQENVVVAISLDDGDLMIDAKADEFIGQFYKQMRLQRMDVMDPLYKERSHRSLGW
ncbi:hypothetical protein PIB30_067465 [Stylosanthes scabra]|uniref:Ovate family protein n=1 Tax=Stylosanthes scabra TaxID=79078 RepID=A0ABU6RNE1_9FABA|nr:hypothetical protein [Stylosanthes scabra]